MDRGTIAGAFVALILCVALVAGLESARAFQDEAGIAKADTTISRAELLRGLTEQREAAIREREAILARAGELEKLADKLEGQIILVQSMIQDSVKLPK